MANADRLTHIAGEVLRVGDPEVRITHIGGEVLRQSYATHAKSASLDSILIRPPITTGLDAYLKRTEELTADLDALLKASGLEKTADIDAVLYPGHTARAYGEQSPSDPDEYPIGWNTWSDGAGGSPTVIGDAEWGKLQLMTDEIAHSPVYEMLGGGTHGIEVTLDKYGSASGSFKTYIRGQAAIFGQDDGSPGWEEYTAPINKTWNFIQVKLEGQ